MADKYVMVFHDWPEATRAISYQEKGRLIEAIVKYSRGDDDWEELLKGNERFLFPMFQAQIDRNDAQRERAAQAHRASGKLGGRPKNQNGFDETKNNQNGFDETKTPNKEEYKEEEENKDKDKDKGGNNARARTRFTAPTVDEVKAYADEKGCTIDAERFVAYYESNGWRVGKNPMRDWRAAVRNWIARDRQEGKTPLDRRPQSNPALDYAQRTYTDADFEDLFVGSPAWCEKNPEEARKWGFIK